jgi:uncharacterized protein YndB with AHSA1/START domain
MSYESLSLSELIPATEEEIYSAWLNSNEHSAFTGDQAEIDPVVGGRHSTFGGYAQGAIIDLIPARRIVQTWRTNDFPEGSPDSRLELTLEATVGGTMVTLLHTEIPDGQSDNYREGWVKYYFEALKKYFAEKIGQASDEELPLPTSSNGLSEHKKPPTRLTARAKTPAPKPAVKAAAAPAKPKAKAKAKAKPKAKTKAKVKAKTKATKAKSKARPAAKTKARKASKAKVKVKAKTKTKTKAKASKKPAKSKRASAGKKKRR